jgi:diguanylate cyclase (GGDEF)-like protein
MQPRSSTPALRAVLVVLGTAAWLLVAVVLRDPPAPLRTGDVAWVVPILAAVLTVAAVTATLSCLVTGLRGGSLAILLRAGGSAALIGTAVGLLTSVASLAAAAASIGAYALLASIADRFGTLVHGRAGRLAVAAVAVLVSGVVAVIGVAPVVGAIVAPSAPGLLVAGVVLAAIALILAIGRESSFIMAATLAGLTSLWLSEGQDANLLLATFALLGVALATTRAMLEAHDVEPAAGEVAAIPEVLDHIADGILRFDGRLQLRTWNVAAERLLALDEASAGSRLEDLMGVSLAQLPSAGEPRHIPTATGGLDVALHRDPAGVTVVVRDPAASHDAARLGRELRGTIEELVQTRRTVELQRIELERAATIDPLTGVPSRKAILDRLNLEVAEARRYHHPVAVVLLDVDRFAELNARLGIDGGDAILREVALRTKLRVREADLLGRVGSDCFLAILPHTDDAGAATFADALRRRIAARPIVVGGEEVRVTVSAGLAVIRDGDDLYRDGLLARADEALVSAQVSGGDRIALDRLHGLARLSRGKSAETDAQLETGETAT